MPEQFRVDSITLGEMLDVEAVSGREFGALTKSRTGMVTVARFLLALRRPDRAQSPQELWDDLMTSRPLGPSFSASPSSPD